MAAELLSQGKLSPQQCNRLALDQFLLCTTLGVGTFGRVRLVRVKGDSSDRVFALKILKKSVVLKLKQVDHITNEKKIMMQLESPFIPAMHASFQDRFCLYILTEFVVGGELFKRLRTAGRFPNDVALFYATEIVHVFEYLHRQNIAYRDLKPENVLIDHTGHTKLIDFGFAKVITEQSFTLCGTPEYLAPETITHQGHNQAVDWWALGILIYEMLVGNPPFYHDNPYSLYQLIIAGQFEYPVFVQTDAQAIISSLLIVDKARRLGARNGANDVKNHEWFSGVDFQSVANKEIPPPWLPEVARVDDTSNYDEYPESTEPELPNLPPNGDPFIGF